MVTNGDTATQNNVLVNMNLNEVSSLAEQFVLQYYTVMNQCPQFLHRFYSDDSVLIYESQPVTGQADINNLFSKLNLKDTHVVILKVDALKGHGNSVMVQVCGEQGVAGTTFRRFMRSFTLYERGPNSFAVIGDIFRFQDRVYIPDNKQHLNASENDAKHAGVKQSTKAPTNGPSVENKNAIRHEHVESKVEKQLPKKVETEGHIRPASPKAPIETAPRKPAADVNVCSPSVHKTGHVEPSISSHNKSHQQATATQQQVSEHQKTATNVPLSWAQRASSNAATMPQPKTPQTTKPVIPDQTPQNPVAKTSGNAQKSIRVGVNNSAAPAPGRPQNQPQPQQPGPSTHKESNSEWTDNVHAQGHQGQHGGRGGFGGQRGNMRGAGGGNRGVNRGHPRGGNRGVSNASAAPARQ